MYAQYLALLGLGAVALAQEDSSSGFNGVVLTSRETSLNVDVSTSYVPVTTAVRNTDTDTLVETNRQTIAETTDFGTSATNTIVQVATTSDVNLASGYAYTTGANGQTIATYTGTDRNAPQTTDFSSAGAVSSAAAASSVAVANGNNPGSNNGGASSSSEGAGAMVTAAPYAGAAALAGIAAFLAKERDLIQGQRTGVLV
ncbi:uncharacterized protein LTR77_001990 [Saxophila tyrrhenica]|uniref:Uncharacterized protein n=1 Tax=Saxophila tyrrhenica TaxID=1690608 RepID=A0AAV9PH99_9PEZI|nr:hypothetical protein LTR77_001990 [Saxophila tyrrhenica]